MRTIPAAILSGLSAETVRIIYLVRLVFDGGTIGWNTGFRDISFDAVNYLGLGDLTSMSAAKEEAGVKASGFTVGISGIKSSIVSLLLSEPYLNRPAYVHYTLLDADDKIITGNPVLLFRGKMNNVSGDQGAKASFSVELKSRFADWERPRKIRYTDAEQQKIHPGDKGMEFIAQLSQAKLIWPRAAYLPDIRD
jgi:hypothetical protein